MNNEHVSISIIIMLLKELERHVEKETSRLSEKQDAEKVELRTEVFVVNGITSIMSIQSRICSQFQVMYSV